jgi:hypothetical protein
VIPPPTNRVTNLLYRKRKVVIELTVHLHVVHGDIEKVSKVVEISRSLCLNQQYNKYCIRETNNKTYQSRIGRMQCLILLKLFSHKSLGPLLE